MNAFAQAGTYLVQTLGSVYLLIVMLRFLLQLLRADFQNPISQFVIKATHIPSRPIRKLLPTYRTFDGATLVLAILVQWLVIQLTATINGASIIHPGHAISWSVLGIISLVLNIYFYGLLAVIILSWVAPYNNHPAIALLYQIIEPVTAPFRRLIPPLGGLDLSPIFMFLVIGMLQRFVNALAHSMLLPAAVVPGI
ncbi:MAG: YggT family protein [Porticoccaceae bacterium]|nr:YggT family protein [Pseudomonadales bacterium]MCP5173057.1 YggT family protein [Pseudomonadales bacterium]MCP5302531.1 YggT family protein [Pseudomonadales bacterium]